MGYYGENCPVSSVINVLKYCFSFKFQWDYYQIRDRIKVITLPKGMKTNTCPRVWVNLELSVNDTIVAYGEWSRFCHLWRVYQGLLFNTKTWSNVLKMFFF